MELSQKSRKYLLSCHANLKVKGDIFSQNCIKVSLKQHYLFSVLFFNISILNITMLLAKMPHLQQSGHWFQLRCQPKFDIDE